MFGFRGLGWFVCSVIVAVGSYLATSQGALERARLDGVEANIIAAKKEIRSLETEFNTRANLVQLGEWNGNVLKLAAPAPSQYLPDEQALARLDQPVPVPAVEAKVVAAVIPAGTPRTDVQTAAAAKPATTAQRDGLAAARGQAVAMIDDKMLADLRKRGEIELSALR